MTNENIDIVTGTSVIFRVPARLADVRLIGLSVHALFSDLGFSDVDAFQLELAITEAANNIIKHSYKFQKNTTINLKFSTTPSKVTCVFADTGKFENFLTNNGLDDIVTDTKILPPSSRGIFIICDVMDEVTYRRSGDKNILTLVKYLKQRVY
jgi:anti-sigma regulatory factor (Ser/Thr protein kinase)